MKNPNRMRLTEAKLKKLIALLPMLREGVYPQIKDIYANRSKTGVKTHASFEIPAGIAAEIDWLIEKAGEDGLLVEMVYSSTTKNGRIFVQEHIARAQKADINEVNRRVHKALDYMIKIHNK